MQVAEDELGRRTSVFFQCRLCALHTPAKTVYSPQRLHRFGQHRIAIARLSRKVIRSRQSIKRTRILNLDPVGVLIEPDGLWSLIRSMQHGIHRSEERRVGKECRSRWS